MSNRSKVKRYIREYSKPKNLEKASAKIQVRMNRIRGMYRNIKYFDLPHRRIYRELLDQQLESLKATQFALRTYKDKASQTVHVELTGGICGKLVNCIITDERGFEHKPSGTKS